MKNSKIRKIIIVLTFLCVIATCINPAYYFLLPIILSLLLKTDFRDASSIGIIGGADGPTTIFLSNSKSSYITIILAMLSLVGIIYLLSTRRKNNKDYKNDNQNSKDN